MKTYRVIAALLALVMLLMLTFKKAEQTATA